MHIGLIKLMREVQRLKLIKAGIGKAQKTSNRREYSCMKMGCKEKAIKSHSQQKKCQLDSIAENGWVYSVEKGFYNIFSGKPRELLVKKTITESSRYKGYCNSHDTEIFSSIENENLDVTNVYHNYLLLLRSVSYEFANKRDSYLRQIDILRQVGDLMYPQGQSSYEASTAGIKLFLDKDSPYYFQRLKEIDEAKSYSDNVIFRSFELHRNLGVSCTTCFSPLREKHSEWMAEHIESPQPFITLSIVPSQNRTLVSFCWFTEFDELCSDFKNLVNDEKFISILNMYAFTESEDVCISPSLWEKLSIEDRQNIYRHMGNSDSLPNAEDVPLVMRT